MREIEWKDAVEVIGPRLFRYFKFKGCGDWASDLTQETFVRLLRHHERFDSSRGPLIAFAIGIAQNVWREHVRNSLGEVGVRDIQDLSEPSSDFRLEIERQDDVVGLRRHLTKLPRLIQDILYLYFDEELTSLQIAEVLQIPEGTIKSHLHRAKNFLREEMAKENP